MGMFGLADLNLETRLSDLDPPKWVLAFDLCLQVQELLQDRPVALHHTSSNSSTRIQEVAPLDPPALDPLLEVDHH